MTSEGFLEASHLAPQPLPQLRTWLAEAIAAGMPEPTAMTLATVSPDGGPSARMVLLKEIDERGLVFFTNLESVKAGELAALPRAAAVLHWAEQHRQVRARGVVERTDDAVAAAYFATRARISRIGAWASPQSRPLASRHELEEAVRRVEARFSGADVSLPPFWGGYRLVPDEMEFWQGQRGRLHDRLVYRPGPGGEWEVVRLAP